MRTGGLNGENTMPTEKQPMLSEVLGALVSSVAQARQIADIAAANLAYAYQRHELLRGMPVPRLRFRSIEVNMPVIIRQVHESKQPILDTSAAIAQRTAAEVQRRAGLAAQKLRLTLREDTLSAEDRTLMENAAAFWERVAKPEESENFRAAVEAQITVWISQFFALGGSLPVAASEGTIRTEVARAVRNGIRTVFRNVLRSLSAAEGDPQPGKAARLRYRDLKQFSAYDKVLRGAAQLAADTCFCTPSQSAELELAVCTDDIKTTGGGSDSITRLHFTLLEEGLEWVEDAQGSRLMTE